MPKSSATSQNPALPARNAASTPLLLIAVLLAAGLAAYSSSFQGAFVFDDIDAIVRNPNLNSLNPLRALDCPPDSPLAGRPVAAYTFALNRYFGGLAPWPYHAVNLAIHLAAGLTLFGVVRRAVTDQPREVLNADFFAFVITLLWLLHPLQTEAVTYIIQRTECLATLFILLTIYSVQRSAALGAARGPWYAAAVLSAALGMATKEIVAVLPLLVLLFDRAFLSGDWRSPIKRRAPLYIGLAATWLIAGILLTLQPRRNTASLTGRIAPLDYLWTQAGVILHYLRSAFWPDQLSIDYNDWPIVARLGDAWLPVSIVALLVAATAFGIIRNRRWAFPAAAFFLILAPTSSLVPILSEPAADRRMYLPLACILVLAASALSNLATKLARRRSLPPLGIAASALALALSIGTWQRNRLYQDPPALYRDTLRKRPNNDRLMNSLAVTLMQSGRQNDAEALEWLLKAEQIRPDHPVIQSRLGWLMHRLSRDAEAEPRLRKSVSLRPQVLEYRILLGGMLLDASRFADALEQFQAAAQLAPQDPTAKKMCGAALMSLNRPSDALPFLLEAARLEPGDDHTQEWLGEAFRDVGRDADAAAAFRTALQLNPANADARAGLASLSPASAP